MRTTLLVSMTGLLLSTGASLLAHHSLVAEYNPDDPIKVEGVVTKVEWTNPHIWFYVDVIDEQGKVTNWGFSGGAPGILMRRGILRTRLQIGDTVRVEGLRARDGSNNASGGPWWRRASVAGPCIPWNVPRMVRVVPVSSPVTEPDPEMVAAVEG